MKMSDVFKDGVAFGWEETSDDYSPCVTSKGENGGYFGVFNTKEQAEAAARAIGCHDDLVEAIQAIYSECSKSADGLIDCDTMIKVESALEKAQNPET